MTLVLLFFLVETHLHCFANKSSIMPKTNTMQSALIVFTLYDSEKTHPSGQTKRKTETETLLALAQGNEHQMYLSLFPPCLLSVSLSLSLLFKLLEVLPNWVLNANQEVECSKIKANAGRMASPSGWLGFRESRAGPLAPSEALREISCLMNTLIRTITIYKMIISNEGR